MRTKPLDHVGVEVGPIHEPEWAAGDEGAGLEIPVPEALVEQPGGILVLGAGLLAVLGGPCWAVRVPKAS